MYLYLDKEMAHNRGMDHQHRKTQFSNNQEAKRYGEQCCNYREFNMQPFSKMNGELLNDTITHLHLYFMHC